MWMKFFAYNGSFFDRWVILNNEPIWCEIVNPFKTARGLFAVKIFDGFCDVKEN